MKPMWLKSYGDKYTSDKKDLQIEKILEDTDRYISTYKQCIVRLLVIFISVFFPPVFSKFSTMNWYYFCRVLKRNTTQKHKRAI